QGIGDCPHCGYEVQPSFIHCPDCGKSLRVKCKSCEMYLEPEWKICPFCGARQRAEKKEIKAPAISNIDTLPNKKILQWGRKIDSFFKGINSKIKEVSAPKKKSENNKKSKKKK
ncbi:MAG: zinc ribbon domain-containing protein, partial [bacterium]